MPEEEYVWLEREHLLHFEEISRVVDAFTTLGVDKVRLTGGEPLLRKDLAQLVALLAAKPALHDLALTTNAMLLADQAAALKDAGLKRLNVSLDTLQPGRFKTLTRQDEHDRVMAGVRAAVALFGHIKVDTVVMRGVNDDEIEALLDFGATIAAEIRFIEYMDVAGATHWSRDLVVPRREILERLRARHGEIQPVGEPDSTAPADRYRLPDGRVFGVISSTTEPFCRTCDRARLTADGVFFTCLYATAGLALRDRLRAGATSDELAALVADRWRIRADQGAEERLASRDRTVFLPVSALRADPHLEMHKRGG